VHRKPGQPILHYDCDSKPALQPNLEPIYIDHVKINDAQDQEAFPDDVFRGPKSKIISMRWRPSLTIFMRGMASQSGTSVFQLELPKEVPSKNNPGKEKILKSAGDIAI
jgi:hypothetical protein